MITRIVKMHFRPEEVDHFLKIYHQSRPVILSMQGCRDVTLHRQAGRPEVMFTLSVWDSVADLDAYRGSAFFRDTWTKTKSLFESKAEAWSLEAL
ncbi:MAG: antibiotic biosynthesis monooxygenase [Saprospiraceae bacterium]|nr:antibiotic biosynthesis monooxygenase [Saprospiraceae bacterium]